MAVEVYFWPPKSGNVGHAAIMADGGQPEGAAYFSAWPGTAASIFFGPATFNAYQDDLSSEGGKPAVVRLTRLDETAIKEQMQNCRTANRYSFIALNCATQASICLNAGVPGGSIRLAMDLLSGSMGFLFGTSVISTPWNLYLYAKSLEGNYA